MNLCGVLTIGAHAGFKQMYDGFLYIVAKNGDDIEGWVVRDKFYEITPDGTNRIGSGIRTINPEFLKHVEFYRVYNKLHDLKANTAAFQYDFMRLFGLNDGAWIPLPYNPVDLRKGEKDVHAVEK